MNRDYLASGNKKIKIGDATIVIKKLSYGNTKQFITNIDTSSIENIDNMIINSIESWDLTDDNNKELPISKETLDKLTTGFVNQLSQEILNYNNLGVEEAKNLPKR